VRYSHISRSLSSSLPKFLGYIRLNLRKYDIPPDDDDAEELTEFTLNRGSAGGFNHVIMSVHG
jgi:hypothetical protein